MNICMLTERTSVHRGWGGKAQHGEHLCLELARRGHRVTVIAPAHPTGIDSEERDGVQVHYLRNVPAGYFTEKWWRESVRMFEALNKRSHFDLVWGQGFAGNGLLGGALKPPPTVVFLHGTFRLDLKTKIASLRTSLYLPKSLALLPYLLYHHLSTGPRTRYADAIIAVSKELAKEAIREGIAPRERVYVIPNGVDLQVFKPSIREGMSIRARYDIRPGDKVALLAGRVEPQKGFHLAVKAFVTLCKKFKAKLMIVGEGRYLGYLKKMVRRLGLIEDVIFCGSVPRDEMPAYYNACDVFVMPALGFESFPLAVVEAMACGKPVIASRIGGIPTAIDHGRDGILVRAGDVGALAEALSALLKDTERSRELGNNARRKAEERFGHEQMVESVIQVFQTVAAGAR